MHGTDFYQSSRVEAQKLKDLKKAKIYVSGTLIFMEHKSKPFHTHFACGWWEVQFQSFFRVPTSKGLYRVPGCTGLRSLLGSHCCAALPLIGLSLAMETSEWVEDNEL